MRGLIILCLISAAIAAPQAYNYVAAHHPHAQYGTAGHLKDTIQTVMTHSGLSSSSHHHHHHHHNLHNALSSGSGSGSGSGGSIEQQTTILSSPAPQPRYLPPSSANSIPTTATIYHHQLQSQQQQQQLYHKDIEPETIVSKRFFIHAAPEEPQEEVHQKTITVGKSRKNYNVVFIKAPHKSAPKTSIKISPAIQEDKTVIYVLAKKPDASEIDAQVHETIAPTSKPEVYFIKYKTQEEAEHAQRTIQSQYDHLGGSTHISHEGIAPISSVIGALDAANNHQTTGVGVADYSSVEQEAGVHYATDVQLQHETIATPHVPSAHAYLPPSAKYYR